MWAKFQKLVNTKPTIPIKATPIIAHFAPSQKSNNWKLINWILTQLFEQMPSICLMNWNKMSDKLATCDFIGKFYRSRFIIGFKSMIWAPDCTAEDE